MKKIDDVIINKAISIKRCVERAREDYYADKVDFLQNFTRQDSVVLNIQRACEQAIDLANYVVKLLKLGIPNDSAEGFALLANKKIISNDLAEKLRKMIGFRNIAVHEYQKINLDITASVVEKNLDDLLQFAQDILKLHSQN
jgi:uncharacterized protein YutE (UPF0331/DUF86 family)